MSAVVAQIGGFLPVRAVADGESAATASVVTGPPVAAKQIQPQSSRFPDSSAVYVVTNAVTGSTIDVIDANNESHRVTLLGIRAPKLDENFGLQAKTSLANTLNNKTVTIRLRSFTKEADTIAEVLCDGTNIGLEQIRTGMGILVVAEIAGLSAAEQAEYLDAAVVAKTGKYGIWSDRNALASMNNSDQTAAGEPVRAPISPYYDSRAFGMRGPSKIESGTARQNFVNEIPEPEPGPVVSEVPGPAPVSRTEKVNKAPVETENRSPARAQPPSASGRKFVRGPFGGCYYINSNGNRSYVDRSMCN